MCECVYRCVYVVLQIFRAKDRVEKILSVELGWGSREREGKVRCLSVNEKSTFRGLHVEGGVQVQAFLSMCVSALLCRGLL